MSYWKKIMEGFSYKTKSGAPDFTNPNHRLLLRKELLNSGWNENAVNALLHRLTETKDESDDSWWDKKSPEQKAQYLKDHPNSKKAKEVAAEKEKDQESAGINRKKAMDKSAEHIQKKKSEGQKKKDREVKEEYDRLKEENKKLNSKERKARSQEIVANTESSSEEKATQLAGLVDGTNETTVELIESVNDGLDTGQNLPAGTPDSTFAEKGGVQRARNIKKEMDKKRKELAKKLKKKPEEITDEQVIDSMADDEVANPTTELARGRKKAWVKTMLRTAAAQEQSIKDNAEEYDSADPVEILGGGVSDERTITTIKSHCDSKIQQADKVLNDPNASKEDKERAQKQKDHYEFTKKWLDNPDTDSFLLYKTKDGHIGVKHISNKKGFKDPALNTSVLKRGKKTAENSRKIAKERGMSTEDAKAMEENLNKTTQDAHNIVKDADSGMREGNRNVSKRAVKVKDKRMKELEDAGQTDSEEYKELVKRKAEGKKVVQDAKKERRVQERRQNQNEAIIGENYRVIEKEFEVLDSQGKPDKNKSGLRKGEDIGRTKGRWYYWDEKSEDWKAVSKSTVKDRLGTGKSNKALVDAILESDDAGREIGILDNVIAHGEGITRNTDEFGEILTSGRGSLPGKSYKEQTDYANKVLETGSNGGGRGQVEPYLKHAGWNGTAKELQAAIKKARKEGNQNEVRRLCNITARAVSMATASGEVTDNTSKLTTKLSQKLTEVRSADDAFPDENSLDSPPPGQGSAAKEIRKHMNNGDSFDEAKKKYIMDRYNIQSEEEYNALMNQREKEHLGALNGDGDSDNSTWKKYTGSMNAAHAKLVGDMTSRDEKWKEEQGWDENDKRNDENGPEAEAYVRTFMEQMHWEQYIMGEAPRKTQSIDGHEVTPEMYYKCLNDLSKEAGFKSKNKEGTPEYRKDLVNWLGKNAKPSPDDDAISIGPDGTDGRPKVKLGKDEMRTAGTAKKAHGYNGEDLTKCLITEAGAK